MKPRPQRKEKVKKILVLAYSRNTIWFRANTDIAMKMEEFGTISWNNASAEFCLWVSPAYDFTEVLEYMEDYDED